MTDRARWWVNTISTGVFVAITGYVAARTIQTCQATKACEAAGNVEAADCKPSADHSHLSCEWRCVETAPGKDGGT